MDAFWFQFKTIINMDLCAAQSSWWYSCVQKTYFKVAIALFFLLCDIIWTYVSGIVIAIMVIIIVATIKNYNRRLRALTELGMNQSQFQETTVWVNGRSQPQIYQSRNAIDSRSLTPAHNRPAITKSRSRSNIDLLSNDQYEEDDDRPARQHKRASMQTRRHFEDSDLEIDNARVSRRKSLGARASKDGREKSWQRQPGQRLERSAQPTREVSFTDNEIVTDTASVNGDQSQTRTSLSAQPNQQHQQQYRPIDLSWFNNVQQAINDNSQRINFPAPPKFSKGTNVVDWMREMDLYIELINVRDKKKTLYWAYLDEATRKMLRDVHFDENDDIALEQLKQKLEELFGKIKKSPLEHMKDFTSRVQSSNENVRIYAQELQRLAQKAFPNDGNIEASIIDQFVEGVVNKKLQHEFLTNRPESLNQMLKIATNFENAYMRQNKHREPTANNNNNSKQSPPSNTSSPKPANNRPQTTQQYPIIGNYNRTNQQQQPPLNTTYQATNNYNQPQTSQQASRATQDVRKCFRCGSQDHVIKFCPVLATPNNQGNDQTHLQVNTV